MNVFLNSTTCVHHLCGFYLPVKTQEMGGGENKIGIFEASSGDKSLLFCCVFFLFCSWEARKVKCMQMNSGRFSMSLHSNLNQVIS